MPSPQLSALDDYDDDNVADNYDELVVCYITIACFICWQMDDGGGAATDNDDDVDDDCHRAAAVAASIVDGCFAMSHRQWL